MSGLVKHFTAAEIASFPNIYVDIGGVNLDFHTLAYKVWKFKARRKYANGCVKLVAWRERPLDSRNNVFSIKLRGIQPELIPGTDHNEKHKQLYDWPKFFDQIQDEIKHGDKSISFASKSVYNHPPKILRDYSREEILAELEARYVKPKRKKLKPNNVIDFNDVLERLRTNIEQEERFIA